MEPPSGTRDFLPEDVKLRDWAFGVIRGEFERSSFVPIETPALERIETLTGEYGDEGEKLIFKILKRGDQAVKGEADLALRYDLTIPLVRFYSKYRDRLPRPFRRYHIGPVWRADRPGKGRFREFYQCDVDTVGSASLLCDAEVILTLSRALASLDLSGFVVRLNSRKVLTGLLDAYGVSQGQKQDVLTAIDKLDKIGIEGVAQELADKGVSKPVVSQVIEDLRDKDSAKLRERVATSGVGQEGLQEVDELISLAEPSLEGGKIEFSPFLARGLDYYTGPIFEICLEGAAGSIAGGGRYDELIGKFSPNKVPATGGSLGIERILSILAEKNQDKSEALKPQVFITVWDRESRSECLKIATEIRDTGLTAEVSLEDGRIGNQVQLASGRGARFCLFYGPDEQKKNEVTLKNLSTAEQKSVSRKNIAQTIKDLVERG